MSRASLAAVAASLAAAAAAAGVAGLGVGAGSCSHAGAGAGYVAADEGDRAAAVHPRAKPARPAAESEPGSGERGSGERGSGEPGSGERGSGEPGTAAAARERPEPVFWLKGSTHVHTVYSGDSDMTVDDAIEWYGEHGYDFIVITDHNRVTEVESAGRPLVLRGIELTHNPATCEPPPPEADGKCRIHINGLGLTRTALSGPPGEASALEPGARPPPIEWKNQTSSRRLDMYQAGIDKVRELGGIVQINHPSWHWGMDGALLAELGRRGTVLVEIANMGFARWNAGDGAHPSSEALWDAALSRGVTLYGVASDDAHDYLPAEIAAKRAAGRPVYQAGTGWVMVRAARRPDAIRAAIARGDFYATTGVALDRVELAGGALRIDVAASSPGEHEIVFIGQGGAELARVKGRSAHLALADAPAGYVRAVVTRGDGARAWTQPVRVPAAPTAR
ncbi:MAG TPA: hypothetical protein VKB80_31385 [Kofleriaceae bacterium]|nr:hypothetical protein [Kofleriaceae bacterium]